MKEAVVAVLDVGKTNKKVSLYSHSFQVRAEARTAFETRAWNGIEAEDTERLWHWFLASLKKLSADYDIRAIAPTTHGATFVLLREDGKLALPVISYTASQGAEVQEEFYEVFGAKEELNRKTGTADIGFCNMAKVLHYIRTRLPESWELCAHGLFYGPYFGYLLTGIRGLEPTFPGNHTYFWDYADRGWSEVARRLDADRLFGSAMRKSWEPLGAVKSEIAAQCGLPADCRVALGIHDSNANYLPYLAKGYKDFLLNSTGTWAVMMRSSDSSELSAEDVANKIFFNQDALGRPVRTSLMTVGMDYDAFRAFSPEKDLGDRAALGRVIAARELFVIPGVLEGGSAFPGARPGVVWRGKTHPFQKLKEQGGMPFSELGQEYLAALDLGLAIGSAAKLAANGIGPGTTVLIEGGFSKNPLYCELLATLCPQQTLALTSMTEGTSLGAAITAWMCATGESLETAGGRFDIETREVKPRDFGDIDHYRAAFNQYLQP